MTDKTSCPLCQQELDATYWACPCGLPKHLFEKVAGIVADANSWRSHVAAVEGQEEMRGREQA